MLKMGTSATDALQYTRPKVGDGTGAHVCGNGANEASNGVLQLQNILGILLVDLGLCIAPEEEV